MRRKQWLTAACALLFAVLALGLTAMAAAEPLDLTKECILTVNPCDLNTPQGKELAATLKKAGLVVDLYRVAGAVKEEGADSYGFSLEDPFAALELKPEMKAGDWAQLAQQAAKTVQGATPALTPLKEGATVARLEPGLYLLVARGDEPQEYWKTITLKAEENGGKEEEKLATQVKAGGKLYRFLPELVAVPSKEAVNGEINTANPGEWLYDITVNLKPEEEEQFGQIEIIKRLLTYDTERPATFVFRVKAELGGRVVYDEVVSLKFTSPGEKHTLVGRLPVGATVTVEEIYSGTSYTLVSASPGSAVVDAEEAAQFTFVNDYDGTGSKGGSITNKFSYDGSKWSLSQQEDNAAE